MNLIVYEDDDKDYEILETCINNLFKKENIQYDLYRCINTTDLFRRISACDVLFLDIELGELNGIEIGKEIRKENLSCAIIIVSSHSKYLIDGYKIQANRYLLKPLEQKVFDVEMRNILYRYFRMNYGFRDKKISLNRVLYKDIIYIESIDHKTGIHFTNGKIIYCTYPLSYWKKIIPNQLFAQPYRCYLVNLMYIYDYTNDEITLTNNEKIPVSRFYKSLFFETYMKSLHLLV